MNWFLNIFKKTKIDNDYLKKSDEEWEAHISYLRGKKYFFNFEWNEALVHFDKVIDEGYIFDNIFEYRGICLQSLGYEFDAIEDFNKSILISPNDCNLYYTRSISKDVILDYEGEIEDIEKAIELSKKDTPLNRKYNEDAINNGYENGLLSIYEIALLSVKSRLEFDTRKLDKNQLKKELKHIKRR